MVWDENDQWLTLEYSEGIPWDEVSVGDEFRPNVGFKRGRDVGIFDSADKLRAEAEKPEELIENLEGRVNLLFRFHPPNLREYDISDTRAGKKRTRINVEEWFADELSSIEEILSKEDVRTSYETCLNTNFYIGWEDLQNGLSAPVNIETDIQGMSAVSYNPSSDIELWHYSDTTVVIEDSFIESLPEHYQISNTEKNLRGKVISEEYPETPIEVRIAGEEYELQPRQWRKVDYPVNKEKIAKLADRLDKEGFNVERYQLGGKEQPKDFRVFTTDYERIG